MRCASGTSASPARALRPAAACARITPTSAVRTTATLAAFTSRVTRSRPSAAAKSLLSCCARRQADRRCCQTSSFSCQSLTAAPGTVPRWACKAACWTMPRSCSCLTRHVAAAAAVSLSVCCFYSFLSLCKFQQNPHSHVLAHNIAGSAAASRKPGAV